MKQIVVAIDSLKGCLSSAEANMAAREGVLRTWPEAEVWMCTVSDGGEGWLAAYGDVWRDEHGVLSKSVEEREVEVCDPLMRPIRARYLRNGTLAVIEVAQACGLGLLKPEERNPLLASSYGVGQLIADAFHRGCTQFLIGLGGSGTSDAGRGMLQACRDTQVLEQDKRPQQVTFTLATDVTNPLCGGIGAAAVFGPQKGATPEMVGELDQQASIFAQANATRMGFDCSEKPGAGAAGGLGYALMQFFGASCQPGAEVLMDALHFDELLSRADIVLTGEGRADAQTLMGKLPHRILLRAQQHDVPCYLLAGGIREQETLLAAGFEDVCCFNPPDLPLSEALRKEVAQRNIASCVSNILSSKFS